MDKCSDNFDRFKNHLWSLSYQELNKIWLRDRKSKEELESQAKPIVYVLSTIAIYSGDIAYKDLCMTCDMFVN